MYYHLEEHFEAAGSKEGLTHCMPSPCLISELLLLLTNTRVRELDLRVLPKTVLVGSVPSAPTHLAPGPSVPSRFTR